MPATCICGRPDPVTADDGEVICGRCCAVLGMEHFPEKPGASKLSLFLQLERGGLAVKLPDRTAKLHLNGADSSDISAISDICSKLDIGTALQHDVYKIFKSVNGIKFSKAASACFAIYYVCRKDSVPFDEDAVRDAVAMAFGVQHAPTMLSVNFAVNKAVDIPKNAWFAESVGRDMPTTTEANPPLFYLRRQLKRLCAENPDRSYDDLYPHAARLFERVKAGNAEMRAKTAIRQTMLMAGIA